jgi:hypothetical protein
MQLACRRKVKNNDCGKRLKRQTIFAFALNINSSAAKGIKVAA